MGGTDLNLPIIADPDRSVSELYDMIHPGEGDTSTVRSVFIIDPNDKVQLTDRAPVSTPVDWRPGDRVIVSPMMSTEDAKAKFGQVEEVKPYLRWTAQP